MIVTILGFLGSSAFGSIIGAVGSYFTKVEDRKALAENAKFEYQMARLDIQAENLARAHEVSVLNKQAERAVIDGEIDTEKMELEAFTESIKSSVIPKSFKIVDAIRGLMRPLITVYLLSVATYIAVNISLVVGGFDAIGANELLALYSSIITELLFLTSVAVTWWFGSRPQSKK